MSQSSDWDAFGQVKNPEKSIQHAHSLSHFKRNTLALSIFSDLRSFSKNIYSYSILICSP